MQVQPYLNFDGRCEEALAFYKTAIGAKVEMMMRYKDAPDPSMRTPANENKVLHAAVKVGDATVLASDGRNTGKPNFTGIALTITANDGEADGLFKALSAGGSVTMPIAETFFAKKFGMLQDKFGVGWMVIVPKPM